MPDHIAVSTSRADLAAALARGAAGGIPFVGGLVAEIVNSVIPNQKLDRVANFAGILAEELGALQVQHAVLEERLRSSEGSDLLEEGIVQASRATSGERQRRVARIVAVGLSDDVLRYDRTRKLLAILNALTDSEILLLVYYSRTPTMGSPWHRELMERHPALLRPASREMGGPAAERERGAMRDAYERSLLGHGLIESGKPGLRITALGALLLKYADGDSAGSVASAP